MVKIFIDPGHGGTDSGAVGNGIQEKNITLQIASAIQSILINEYSNVEVRMSRTGDETVSLNQRTNMANAWGADFFLSIHINSGGGRGYEDFIHSNLSSASRTAQIQRTIHLEVITKIDMVDRGSKKADFHVLRESNMDAVLTENGFIDNAEDASKMKNPAWVNSVARAHVVGVEKAFNLQRKLQVQSQSTPYKVIIPNLAFWQARALVAEFEQRGFRAQGVALKIYGPNERAAAGDPYMLVIDTDFENAKQLVIELKTRGYSRTYGEKIL
ncbi:N-acetylmuramoyl-L-alanine amidase family protein [Robertmurraya korlensis]|uniref:N-acetylmuramoyl-L-alanine amidase family protein n=1 Tax=Robertmurraya korlensis TaxID=519977 RepID=UPI0008257214|nr:N-acetylmuramoyl-L-alanine amidase [Robertmurraya korlensis]